MSMTESEAIRRLKDHFRVHDDGRPTPYLDEAVSMAIQALEKIQSLEENKTYHLYREYLSIGTVSEFQQLKEKATAKMVWLYVGNDMKCPSCAMRLRNYEGIRNPYCKFCGQQLER